MRSSASHEGGAVQVPFFRPEIGDAEVEEVVACLRSGWLTTGPRVAEFERRFAEAVGAPYAIALNSCTAALHLAVEALGLGPRQAVLVPSMTFAATAEIVRYQGAIPLLVDCEPDTFNMDLADAERKLRALRDGGLPAAIAKDLEVVGMIPVHVGGAMMDVDRVHSFAEAHGLWLIEDAAHAFPAAIRGRRCGEGTARVSCFSFYANKTITTGEGGMATTADEALAERMRIMSLHGLSKDAWKRYAGGRSWDYRIVAPGFKYNLTDVAAAIGLHQLARAEEMRARREAIAARYIAAFRGEAGFLTPPVREEWLHSWHLFPIRLVVERLDADRNAIVDGLRDAGVSCSVHYRPLHLHPYYVDTFGWRPEDCPVATDAFRRNITLPLFSGMREEEIAHVVRTVKDVVGRHG